MSFALPTQLPSNVLFAILSPLLLGEFHHLRICHLFLISSLPPVPFFGVPAVVPASRACSLMCHTCHRDSWSNAGVKPRERDVAKPPQRTPRRQLPQAPRWVTLFLRCVRHGWQWLCVYSYVVRQVSSHRVRIVDLHVQYTQSDAGLWKKKAAKLADRGIVAFTNIFAVFYILEVIWMTHCRTERHRCRDVHLHGYSIARNSICLQVR